MARLTRITTQKKHQHRYNIFLDEGSGERYGFSVDEAILVEHHLQKGMELDDGLIATLQQQDSLHKSYAMAINYLSYRMRTKKEIYDYLVRKEVNDDHIPTVMQRLEQERLLDDAQFATQFVETRLNTTNKGPKRVGQELKEKGVASSIVDKAITAYTYEVQFDKAVHLAQKKFRQNGKQSFRKQLQQLQGQLLQKGFDQQVIKDAVGQMTDERDDGAEWEALNQHGEKAFRKYARKYTGYERTNKVREALYRKGFAIEQINRFIDEHAQDDNV